MNSQEHSIWAGLPLASDRSQKNLSQSHAKRPRAMVACAESLEGRTLLTAAMVHQYSFSRGVEDSVRSSDWPFGANGTLVNGAAVSDNALNLQGAAYAQLPGKLIPSLDFSVTLLARETTDSDGYVELLSQGFSGAPGFYVGHDPEYQIRVGDEWQDTGVDFPRDHNWHQYAVVSDTASNQTRLYIDGQLQATRESATIISQMDDATRLGAQYKWYGENLQGGIADVRIFNGAMTDSQLAGVFAADRALFPPVVDPGGTYVTRHGQDQILDASKSYDPYGGPLTFTWDLNLDGDFSDASGASPTVSWARLQTLGVGNGGHTYRLRVQNPLGTVVDRVANAFIIAAPTPGAARSLNDLDDPYPENDLPAVRLQLQPPAPRDLPHYGRLNGRRLCAGEGRGRHARRRRLGAGRVLEHPNRRERERLELQLRRAAGARRGRLKGPVGGDRILEQQEWSEADHGLR